MPVSDSELRELLEGACGSSSTYDLCGGCGRMHFTDEADNYEEFRTVAQVKPDEFEEHSDGGIHRLHFEGKDFVLGCPCGRALSIGRSFWDSRFFISEFFRGYMNVLSDEHRSTVRAVEDVCDAVNHSLVRD